MYIEEYKKEDINKSEGEIMFKIDRGKYTEISKLNNQSLYIISKNVSGLETKLVNGRFVL
jgi:hypothetical protein